MPEDASRQERKAEILRAISKNMTQGTIPEGPAIIQTIGPTTLEIVFSDIVELHVDAVVNAAQPQLTGGAGVDGAIHFRGGPAILAECEKIISKIGRLETGKAVMTTGGDLPARYVIHAVGPIWSGGTDNEPELLASCYLESLRLADKEKLTTIGFPAISTGAYGYPALQGAEVALQTVKKYLEQEPTGLTKVVFAIFSHEVMGAFRRAVMRIFGSK